MVFMKRVGNLLIREKGVRNGVLRRASKGEKSAKETFSTNGGWLPWDEFSRAGNPLGRGKGRCLVSTIPEGVEKRDTKDSIKKTFEFKEIGERVKKLHAGTWK